VASPGIGTGKLKIERLPADRAIQIAGSLALSLAAAYILVFVILAILRMTYPFELEWIEGAYLDEAYRVSHGFFPYGPPSIFFIPTSKTPLYFFLSAGLIRLFGDGFFAPRLLSFLATLGCFWLLYAIVRRQSARSDSGDLPGLLPGILAAGIYAASFRFAGAWMDTAKTDSLFLFFILAAFYVGQGAPSLSRQIGSGILFALAYFTKQLTLPVVLALAPVSLFATRGRSWPLWAAAGCTGLAAFWGLDIASGGWFSFYTFDTVASHEWQADYWLFWKLFLPKMGPALLVAIFYGVYVVRRSWPRFAEVEAGALESLGLGGALILASWSVFIKTWTYDNGFMLASLGSALLAGLGVSVILNRKDSLGGGGAGSSSVPAGIKAITLGLILLQFGLLFYNPLGQIPTLADRSKAEAFVHKVAGLPGEVLVFQHGYVNRLAGKTGYLHNAPYGDVVGSSAAPGTDTAWRREAVLAAFNQALAEQQFDWIILDRPETSWFPYYIYVSSLPDDSAGFYPVTGARTGPESLLAKNPVARGGVVPLDQDLYQGMFGEGWSQPQGGDRWAVGERASLRVALERNRYWLEVQASPACLDGQPEVRGMKVGWNGASLGEAVFQDCTSHIFWFEIKRGRITDEFNELWFDFGEGPGSSGASLAAFHSIAFVQE
jgi:hypothetical protein